LKLSILIFLVDVDKIHCDVNATAVEGKLFNISDLPPDTFEKSIQGIRKKCTPFNY